MDLHTALETFAEVWVAANTQTAVNSEPGVLKQQSLDELPTMLPKEQLMETTTVSQNSDSHTKSSGGDGGERGLQDDTPVSSPLQGSPLSSGSMTATPQAASPKTMAATKSPTPRKTDSSMAQPGNRSLPIHCMIEQMNGAVNFENASSAPCDVCAVELDSYAILPATTPLRDLVRTALVKLGYTAVDAMNAKGAIQLKNWKPLAFDVITDDKLSTIDDILGELTNSATLRIRLSREEQEDRWADNSVRCAVLSLLKHQSQSTLAKLSPLSQSTISNIANGKYNNQLSAEKCREFGLWYTKYLQETDYASTSGSHPRDTRMTFHPDHELPLLRTWYKNCKTPSHEEFVFFANELNKGYIRQDRPKISPAKLKIWWKNEKQRERRLKVTAASDSKTRTRSLRASRGEQRKRHDSQGSSKDGRECADPGTSAANQAAAVTEGGEAVRTESRAEPCQELTRKRLAETLTVSSSSSSSGDQATRHLTPGTRRLSEALMLPLPQQDSGGQWASAFSAQRKDHPPLAGALLQARRGREGGGVHARGPYLPPGSGLISPAEHFHYAPLPSHHGMDFQDL